MNLQVFTHIFWAARELVRVQVILWLMRISRFTDLGIYLFLGRLFFQVSDIPILSIRLQLCR